MGPAGFLVTAEPTRASGAGRIFGGGGFGLAMHGCSATGVLVLSLSSGGDGAFRMPHVSGGGGGEKKPCVLPCVCAVGLLNAGDGGSSTGWRRCAYWLCHVGPYDLDILGFAVQIALDLVHRSRRL